MENDKPEKKFSIRPLYSQLIFTALSFLVLNILSYIFVRNVVYKNLVRNAENALLIIQNKIENDLNNPKTYLIGLSRTVRTSIIHGGNAKMLQEYFVDLSAHLFSNNQELPGFDGLFGFFENLPEGRVFIEDSRWGYPINYDPSPRIWYQNAVAAGGEIVETMSYADIVSNNNVLLYSICIFDDDGNRLGVVNLRLKIDVIGENIIKAALDHGGYGMLISDDIILIAHPNPDFVGRDFRDPIIPVSIFADKMIEGIDISEGNVVNYTGDKSIAFFRRLSNNWYIGFVEPEGPFYQDLTNMAYTLFMLGIIFTLILFSILIRIDRAKNKSDMESRHKSAFLANMSHEIRTPMNAIIGMTTIGKASDSIERKDHCFSKIRDASNHLLGVINDILDMSKIEANKFEISPLEFNFEKMLMRVVNVINFRVDEKRQNLSVRIDRSIPKTLIGDEQRISQVITNLLANAIKFTPEAGSISVDTCLVGESDGVCTVQLSVTDTGIGITPEQQDRIFRSFEQAESSTTRNYGGAGLGLAISKNIVELMGGKIWLVSEVRKGSVFAFTIKVKRGNDAHKGLLDPDVNLNNVRIMVVDDDHDILDYFMEISHEFKVHCDAAISGEEALKLLDENGCYHIYFVDWKMPGMDGIQLASELKKRNALIKSVVIMITAAEWTTIENEARKAGVDRFLSKPLFPSHIADIINEAIGIDRDKIDEAHTKIKDVFTGRKLLLVEDVDINREIVMELLEPTGIEIDCAANGRDAVRMFSEAPHKYDLIFMDVQMPEMDGYEATRQIRALSYPEAKTIRIIAMTANVFREDIEKCLEAGMDNHLGKPVDFNEVLDKIRHYLPRNRQEK
jgi:signal transduction histidine kinase/DNA-binding response OmpR family regulator